MGNDERPSEKSFEVRSSEHGARFLLRRDNRDWLVAEFYAPWVNAAAQVYMLGGCDGLAHFWSELAENWQGWEGVRTWGSLEGTLELRAASDRLGHVTLEVRLDDGAPFRWRIQGILALEAGQLERIATDARIFCRKV